MDRRSFLQAIAAGMSAAVLPSGVIMPVRPMVSGSTLIESAPEFSFRMVRWDGGVEFWQATIAQAEARFGIPADQIYGALEKAA